MCRFCERGYCIDADAGIIYGRGGKPIRRTTGNGYVEINRKYGGGYLAHRAIWEHVHGPIPAGQQDHQLGTRDRC